MYLEKNIHWMRCALKLAEEAFEINEVPVGALIVEQDQIVASAKNACIQQCDPTAHAEMLVLKKAMLKNRCLHLKDATLYVTLEPCMMCLGAIMHAGVQRVFFGAYDTKAGALGGLANLLSNFSGTCRPDVWGGLCAEESAHLLKKFFQKKRK